MNRKPLKVAIAGLGGYARAHHTVFQALEERGETLLIATCDPALPKLDQACQELNFAARGVSAYPDFTEMMQRHGADLDLMVIATPVHLHAPMHAACVEAGIACYLEKPPTLNPAELAQMLATEQQARYATHVGFHFIHQEERRKLKQRMLDGEFGAFRGASYRGFTRRSRHYFTRNGWAGRLLMHGNLLLDSCCGNAMAHQINNILFFAGQEGLDAWAQPREVQAELYRVNAIEGTDTVFARCTLESGFDIRIAASHASHVDAEVSEERLEFEKASIEVHANHPSRIRYRDGREEEIPTSSASLDDNVQDYLDYLNGRKDRPTVRLVDTRPFVELDALLYVAAPAITQIPKEDIDEAFFHKDTLPTLLLRDLKAAADRWLNEGKLPSEAGFPWAGANGHATTADLPRLFEAVQKLAAPKS
jgi:predicted dehydrogenase